MQSDPRHLPIEPERVPPAFNTPAIVVVLLAVMAATHGVFSFGGDALQRDMLQWLSFVPGFITLAPDQTVLGVRPWWSFVSYAFLHGDWLHLGVNAVWLLAMGTPVARRFGVGRFIAFFAAGSVAGALAQYSADTGSLVPMVGASGGVSALFGGAVRFALAGGLRGPAVHLRPRLSLAAAFTDRTVLSFIVIWSVLNFAFGSGIIPIPGAEGEIAWQAHAGGFAFGLLAFGLFDPLPARSVGSQEPL